jgi:hypothetical protein
MTPIKVNRAPPLIVRFAAFGDVVLLTTLIEFLIRRFGMPVDLLGSGAWTPELLAADPRVGHVQLVSSRRTPYALCRSQWHAVRWLQSRMRGPVYLCDPEPKTDWLLRHANIDPSCIVPVHYELAHGDPHWTDWWSTCGQLMPAAYQQHAPAASETVESIPRLYVSERDIADCDAWLAERGWRHRPLVLIQPGNKRTLKRGRLARFTDRKYWPAERWASVVADIGARMPDAKILLCGAPSEHAFVEDIRRASHSSRVHNLALELPVRRLLPLMLRAHSMISVDTGPAHAAAALDCPLVVMFANERQCRWLPRSRLGRVVPLGGAAGEHSRLVDIDVPEVLSAWRALVSRTDR